jgi:hypothetical protein
MRNKLSTLVRNFNALPMISAFCSFYKTEKFFPMRWLWSGYKMDRQWDYHCYLLFKIMCSVSLFVSLFVFSDAIFALNIFVPAADFLVDKKVIYDYTGQVMIPITIMLNIGFYLKLRLSIKDIRTYRIPYITPKNRVHFYDRKKAGWWSFFGVALFVTIVSFFRTQIGIPSFLLERAGLEFNNLNMTIAQIIPILFSGVMSSFFVHTIIWFEIFLRNYPDLYSSLDEMENVKHEDW